MNINVSVLYIYYHIDMIHEKEPVTNTFISNKSGMNCAAYIAGIIAGVLDGASFPATVTTHYVSMGDGQRDKTVFLVKFSRNVLRREAAFG